VDNSSTKDGSEAVLIIKTLQGERQEHALKFMFKASNNEVKYEAQTTGVALCYTAGTDSVRVYLNS